MTTPDRYQRLAREDEMEATIADCVTHLGGRLWHVRDSRGMEVEDMPDLLIACPPTLALFELKSQRRPITAGQAHVLDLIAACDRLASGIVRPVPNPGELSLDDAVGILKGPHQ